jgi:hypothetical protein
MMNAKTEFLGHIGNSKVKCAVISISPYPQTDDNVEATLPTPYYKEEYEEFLKKIDVEYDSGYGSQELYGNIWYEDGTWSERGEYDGSEWWAHIRPLQIPEDLIRVDRIRDIKISELLNL